MVLSYLPGNRIQGLSSDTKPTTVPDGSVFYETDTQWYFRISSGVWNKEAPTYKIVPGSGTTSTVTNIDEIAGTRKILVDHTNTNITGECDFKIDGVIVETFTNDTVSAYDQVVDVTTDIEFDAHGLGYSDMRSDVNGTRSNGGIIGDQYGCAYRPDGKGALVLASQRFFCVRWSTDWDPSTESNYIGLDTQTFDPGSNYCYCGKYDDDGSHAFIGISNGSISKLSMDTYPTTPYEFTTNQAGSGQVQSYNMSESTGIPRGLDFNSDGTKMYIHKDGSGYGKIYQYTLTTGWDLTTASYASKFFATGMTAAQFRDFCISSDGEYLFTTDGAAGSSILHRFSMSIPWDISTCTAVDTINISTITGETLYLLDQGMALLNNDAYLYVMQHDHGASVTTYRLDMQDIYTGDIVYSVD